jgi:hypothetical protein
VGDQAREAHSEIRSAKRRCGARGTGPRLTWVSPVEPVVGRLRSDVDAACSTAQHGAVLCQKGRSTKPFVELPSS